MIEDLGTNKTKNSMVKHPAHYQHIKIGHHHKNFQSFEVRDIANGIVDSFDDKLSPSVCSALWQVIKYITRCPFKGNTLQDLRKAENYLQDAILNLETEQVKK